MSVISRPELYCTGLNYCYQMRTIPRVWQPTDRFPRWNSEKANSLRPPGDLHLLGHRRPTRLSVVSPPELIHLTDRSAYR